MCIMFPSRVGQAGFRLDTFMALNKYLRGRVNIGAFPNPREMVFTLIPWDRKAPPSAQTYGSVPPPPSKQKTSALSANPPRTRR